MTAHHDAPFERPRSRSERREDTERKDAAGLWGMIRIPAVLAALLSPRRREDAEATAGKPDPAGRPD
ncbi:hypothetical protein ACUN0C_02615 [Faunimonas sp. B44]|uniref:hypothetical protein n=1 Tax=Faunimonas sp. B44 TaxID=3461493 RepID=UPI004044076A